MKNFELDELYLVNPKVDLGEVTRAFATHAQDIVINAVVVKNLDEAISDVSYVVGTTSISAKNSSNILRVTITPQEFAQTVGTIQGRIALLLGRESIGLLNTELTSSDVIVTIPASPAYMTLNVASASAIIFYELWKARSTVGRGCIEEADRESRERLLMLFSQMCNKLALPPHRERLVKKAFRNVVSRAFISMREATLIIGVFRQLLQRGFQHFPFSHE
jgi:TrmH family RNA methyltransferase